jgi:hypothetical protein
MAMMAMTARRGTRFQKYFHATQFSVSGVLVTQDAGNPKTGTLHHHEQTPLVQIYG